MAHFGEGKAYGGEYGAFGVTPLVLDVERWNFFLADSLLHDNLADVSLTLRIGAYGLTPILLDVE